MSQFPLSSHFSVGLSEQVEVIDSIPPLQLISYKRNGLPPSPTKSERVPNSMAMEIEVSPDFEYFTKGDGEDQNMPTTDTDTENPIATQNQERRRLQIDFSDEAFSRLMQIKQAADSKSNAEVIKSALRLYEWVLQQKKENYRFQLVRGNEVKEVEIIL